MIYSYIHFDNLDIIQRKVMLLFPISKHHRTELFYIEDNLKKFLEIEELYANLKRLDLIDMVRSVAFYNVLPTDRDGTNVHVDSGIGSYSLNLPIMGCDGTFVNFYESNKPPMEKFTAGGVPYYEFNPADCCLLDRAEMTAPLIINIKKIHNVVNINTAPRITLLLRLHEFWDYDLWANNRQLNSQA